MIRSARAVIDHDALQHNLRRARQLAPDSRVMAVIKADAYGHGMLDVAHTLRQADGFAVACASEALALRGAGITLPISVFQGFQDVDELQSMAAAGLQPVIHQAWQLDMLEAQALPARLAVWLKVDTGMGRLGLPLDQAQQAWQRLNACEQVSRVGLMSHFANADQSEHTINRQQIDRFNALARSLPDSAPVTSLSNSAGLMSFPDARGDWVRPGIMLYGASPLADTPAADLGLRPAMQLRSRLVAINPRKKGDHIGYGSLWRCPEDMPVGVVGIGYGDGYPRHAEQGTPVWVGGTRTRLLGRVSMDLVTVDLRGIEQARCGDVVELWGGEVAVDEVAHYAGTIAYELLCNVGRCREGA